ncbi:TPA: amidohydrolase [Serratia fonticola]
MRIIDTHNHIWHCQGEHFSWITEDLATLRRDFLIEDLLAVLREHQVDGSMLVQAVPSLAESEWLLAMAEQTEQVKGVIGWADITKGQAVKADLQRLLAKSRRLKGIRYMSQGLPSAHLVTPEFIQGVRCVGELGLVYELLITEQQLADADRLIAACPEVVFVIEHMAKPAIRSGEIEPWRTRLQQIGQRHPNVFCKLSGMTTEADYQRWSGLEQAYQETQPYIAAVFSAFGEDRVMFGSDWPVSLLALPYAGVLSLCQRYLQANPAISADKFFHLVAENVYSLQ